MTRFFIHKLGLISAVAACFLALGGRQAQAHVILPPGSTVEGRTIAEWTEAWWTWAFQAPAATNPLLDETGEFAHVNNDGPVFFIAGGAGGPVTRSFTVPGDRPILVPVLNAVAWREPIEVLNGLVAEFPGAVTDLFASIDGEPVENLESHLEVTGLFSMGPVQPGSLIEALGETAGTVLSPSRAVGYWLMIEGLSPGAHTLRFGGAHELAPGGFSTDITARIQVVPEPGAVGLIGLGLLSVAGMRRRT